MLSNLLKKSIYKGENNKSVYAANDAFRVRVTKNY